ncbi:FitA-like ribbon-helix-helix domain-containing protein [Methylobacillus sp. Pita2]|uniref:FitA-like ribbon-helix-helix domain-containing protein n=2 Tax=Methylobacillus TaxID=404 RepID=UPI0038B4F752
MMASLTIRNLDEGVKSKLRLQAAAHGRSMEQEAREILLRAVSHAGQPQVNFAERVRQRFAGIEIDALPVPQRQPARMTSMDE